MYRFSIQKQRGVSLIELILVLAISGFMVAMVINSFSTRGRGAFDDGMRQALNSLRQVQNEATNGQGPSSAPTDSELVGKGVTLYASSPQNAKYDVYWAVHSNNSSAFINNIVKSTQKSTLNLPSAIKLVSITDPTVTPTVSAPACMLVFSKGSGGDTALPFYFAQKDFNDSSVASNGYGFKVNGSNYVPTYNTAQAKTITLQFQGRDNANYSSKIVINTVTGTMELQQ